MTDNRLREDLRQAYDASACMRDHADYPHWKRVERARFVSHLRVSGLARLLEVGAGTGRDGLYFSDAGYAVTCIDLSPAMVAQCREKRLKAWVMDVADLSFPAAAFDAVYSMNSLLHLPKTELPAVLLELHRVLKPGGLFYFGTYGGYDHEGIYEDDDHTPHRFFSFYEDKHLQRVVGRTFEMLEFRSLEIAGNDPRIRFQSVLLQRPDIGYTPHVER